jgi:hypothetical protein
MLLLVMLNVVLSVVMQGVALFDKYCSAECRYAECHYAECRGAVFLLAIAIKPKSY